MKKRKSEFSYKHLELDKFISLKCSCGNIVFHVDPTKDKVICWVCLMKKLPFEEKKVIKTKTGFPPGWKILPVYVHKNKDVYYKGIIQPKLKGTLPISEIKFRRRRTKKELANEKERKLLKRHRIIQRKKNKGKKKK